MHRPSMVPLPLLLTLLATLADAQQHGRFDGGNRSAGTGASPSPLFEGRTASGNGGGPPPPRRPPSFSPFTPFLSPQSLPRPLSAGRMPRRRLDVEDGRRTSLANNSLEGGGTGRAENGGERWRGGRGMNEQRQRVVDASSPSGAVGLSRMATTTSTNSSSSSLAAGGDPTVPFPLPPKGPFDGGAARKEGRAELLVEKEDKTDLERVKKDGDDDGQGRKRGGEQFPPDDGVLKKSAEEERFRTPPQSVPPLAGRFAPTRTTAEEEEEEGKAVNGQKNAPPTGGEQQKWKVGAPGKEKIRRNGGEEAQEEEEEEQSVATEEDGMERMEKRKKEFERRGKGGVGMGKEEAEGKRSHCCSVPCKGHSLTVREEGVQQSDGTEEEETEGEKKWKKEEVGKEWETEGEKGEEMGKKDAEERQRSEDGRRLRLLQNRKIDDVLWLALVMFLLLLLYIIHTGLRLRRPLRQKKGLLENLRMDGPNPHTMRNDGPPASPRSILCTSLPPESATPETRKQVL
uniref:Transmembrane protein n=1 Tax=Globodera pallida TaxID=36090 RepID=A0A183BYJ4_GLOPA